MGGKKKKRQESTSLSSSSSLRSSSYRRDTGSPATSTANVCCMSGIFHLMSKYRTPRKFLTFGKKQERNAIVQAPTPPPPSKPEDTIKGQPQDQESAAAAAEAAGRISLDQTPRSPAIPAEIRRSSTDSSTSSPRVVARLMGLDDFLATSPAPAMAVSPAAEKRRKLLGALEKCDEDLQALKKIIEAVRATQTPPGGVEMKRREEADEVESEVGSDGPSPVSVLDHRHLSSGYYQRTPNEQIMQQQKPKQQKLQHLTRKKPGDHEDKAISFLNKPSLTTTIITPQHQSLHQQLLSNAATTAAAAGAPWSTAMKESVFEVCRDIERGQTLEVGRIGLILQDIIFRELIDEIIKEFGSCFRSRSRSALPFEACKRQLNF